jgi:S1-C subfamily serine protease
VLLATFGPSTAWAGRRISREGDFFILENHGPIAAHDVMEYDRQGHLVWVSDWARAWVASKRSSDVGAPMADESGGTAASTPGHAATWPPAAHARPSRRLLPSRHALAVLVIGLVVAGTISVILAFRLAQGGGSLTPQAIYEKNVGSVVEIKAALATTYDIYGQPTGGGEVMGTGFVVSEDGYIMTNAHCVSEGGQAAKTAVIIFHGNSLQGPTIEGSVVSADESTDVALIKVDPREAPRLVPVSLGDSSRVTVGEQVVAIGNPLGLDSSLSLGVVSATDRDLPSPNGDVITGGIQTDAAINPGNSGGPLIDTTGHVIGINEQIDTHSGGNEGIGFAVPINTAKSVMEMVLQADRSSD